MNIILNKLFYLFVCLFIVRIIVAVGIARKPELDIEFRFYLCDCLLAYSTKMAILCVSVCMSAQSTFLALIFPFFCIPINRLFLLTVFFLRSTPHRV